MNQHFFSQNLIRRASIVVLLLLSLAPFARAQRQDYLAGVQKFDALMQFIRMGYVDTTNEARLVENAIVETLKELDPHSVYIPKKDVIKANEGLDGNFEGVGIQFEILRDTITVVHAVSGGPSEKLGIMSGDKIIRIDGQVAWGKQVNNQYVLDHLRGKRGTKVQVAIFRKGKKDLIDFTIIREKIPITSIDAAYMIRPGIAYINLNKFAISSMQEFYEAMNRLRSQGIKGMILDLRNNSGGYMQTSIDLSDEFLAPGKLIVYTEGAHSPRENYNATARGLFQTGKLVVMINENSASASEIVSGAIQDWDRGIIVGRRSFGKGLVQRPFNLPDSSQVRLTTARYYNPSGKCIQKPYAEGIDKYYEDFSQRVKHGELIHPDSIKFPDSLKYYTARKRVVYGGGGIMPDVFIPWDSTPISDYYLELRRKNVVNTFTGDYVDKSRKTLQATYPDFASFNEGFRLEDSFMEDFFAYAEKQGVKKDDKGWAASEKLIKSQIKGIIAEKLWGLNELYTVINQYDEEVLKAVEVIQDDALFDKLKIDR